MLLPNATTEEVIPEPPTFFRMRETITIKTTVPKEISILSKEFRWSFGFHHGQVNHEF